MTDPDPWVEELRRLLVWDPTALDRLEADHSPDGSGRCPVCRPDGIKTGRAHSPCRILATVLEAKK